MIAHWKREAWDGELIEEGDYEYAIDETTGLAELPERFYFKIVKDDFDYCQLKMKLIEKGVIFRWAVCSRSRIDPNKEDVVFASAMLRKRLDEIFAGRREALVADMSAKGFIGRYPPKKVQ